MNNGNQEMKGKVVLVTGANSGIGKETARELARMGARVLMHGRDQAKLTAAVEEVRKDTGNRQVEAIVADLSSMAEVVSLADEVRKRTGRLDVLVNNAGVILSKRRVTVDGLETTFAVNHLAPFLLTIRLRDLLEASAPARVVTVSSGWHTAVDGLDFDDLQSEKKYDSKVAYQRSKLANILFTRALARRLEASGVTANSLHPGVVRTGLGMDGDVTGAMGLMFKMARPFFLSPQEGAQTSIYLASSPELAGVSGTYFAKSQEATPSRAALDDTAAERLWRVSEDLVEQAIGAGQERSSLVK